MIRKYDARVDVVRNGATLTTLHAVSPPTVDCNSAAAIKMSMSGVFLSDASVNWLTDELVPVQIIDGVEYPVGFFPVGTVMKSCDENGMETVTVEAYDRCMILNQTKTERLLHFSAGESYLAAVESLLLEAGIVLHITVASDAVLATDREDWPVGTSFLTVINQLLSEINYANIWFDARGYARLEPVKTPLAENIDHTWSDTDGVCVLHRPSAVETDMFDAPNVFIVICSNPDLEAPMVATAVNDNPMSSLSVFRRGRRIARTYQVSNVPDQASLEAYAEGLRLEGMMTSEVATISTVNRPGHGVYDTIALAHPDLTGIFGEVSWHLVLGPGQAMTHKIRRSVIV